MFRGIKQVPAGTCARRGARERPASRAIGIGRSPGSVEPLRLNSDADYFAAFRDALAQAVKRQTMADVEVGAYVSGGIDSTVVVHNLAALDGKQGCPPSRSRSTIPDYDESAAQQAVVEHYRTRHRIAQIQPADIAR